jgi:DUF971 family protein
MSNRPAKISASRERSVLIIDWDDNRVSTYPLSGLRASCPCAECRGGHANMGVPGSPDMLLIPLMENKSAELVSIEMVGNYAIQLLWKDGHSYGIYTWDFMRELNSGLIEES